VPGELLHSAQLGAPCSLDEISKEEEEEEEAVALVLAGVVLACAYAWQSVFQLGLMLEVLTMRRRTVWSPLCHHHCQRIC
jgi:hypothetical protein